MRLPSAAAAVMGSAATAAAAAKYGTQLAFPLVRFGW